MDHQTKTVMFLPRDTEQPDTVSQQLMRSGDVESNPGPVTRSMARKGNQERHVKTCETCEACETCATCDTCWTREPCETCGACGTSQACETEAYYCKEISREAEGTRPEVAQSPKKTSKIIVRKVTSNRKNSKKNGLNHQPRKKASKEVRKEQCKKCGRGLSKHIVPIVCKECKGKYHQNHTEESRDRIDTIKKTGRPWTCKPCRRGTDSQETEEPEETIERPTPGNCMAGNCEHRKIRKGADFLWCTACEGQLHKKTECSNMTRKEIENMNRNSWKCEGCLGKMTEDLPSGETTTPDFKTNSKDYISKLTILQWNADHLQAKVEDLRNYLERRKVDIFFIQETKLTKDKKVASKFPNYTIKRRDRINRKGKEGTRGGGLIVGIKKGIPFREASLDLRGDEDEITESFTIEIPTKNNQKIRLTNVYIPPIRMSEEERARQRGTTLDTNKWPSEPYDCLFGDFNAHSPMWDDAYEEGDARGKIIEDWIGGTGMISLNDGQPTRIHKEVEGERTIRDTAPDLTVVHSSLAERFTTWRPENELGSDHQPIISIYEEPNAIPSVKSAVQYRWKLTDGNWKEFTNEIESNIPTRYKQKNANKLEKKLRKIITAAANKHIRKKKISNTTKTGLTPELKDAVHKRNRLRVDRKNKRKEWVEAAKEVIELTKTERERKWKEYVSTLDMKTDPTQVWRTIHNLEGKHPPKSENEVLVYEGEALIDDISKASAFAKTYKKFSRLPTRKEDRKVRRKARLGRKKTSHVPEECERDITAAELDRVIGEAGMKKAAGEDDIPYEMIKHLGPKAREMLLHIYNKSWGGEEIPNKWRTAIIKTLLKNGKDPKATTSYRPISLTSCLGKIMEKIIADRLMQRLEKQGLLADAQAGFRQNRCTTDQILKLTQFATDQMHRPVGKNASIITFFDYEKAYDKVWRDGLLSKMLDLKIPLRFIRYIRSFLSNRQTRVEINGKRSQRFVLKEGLPQGSSISPLLFIIFINDIGVDLHPQTVASLFADDTAIWMPGGGTDEEMEETKGLLQIEVDKIMKWADTWKMSINVEKTSSLVISSNTANLKWKPELVTEKGIIKTVASYKFLGITIDGGLRFIEHVKSLVRRCRRRVNILKCMAGKDWGNSLEVLRALYLQYVRSCLEYASSSFIPLISATTLKQLERVQNEALRAIAGLYKTCPIDFLRLETNIEPLALRYQKNDAILYDKYMRLPDTDSRKAMATAHFPSRLDTRFGWRNTVMDNVIDGILRDETTPPTPPWRDLPNLSVEFLELDRRKDQYRPEELKRMAIEKIESYSADYYIYTDGSTDGKQERGGAGVYIENARKEVVAQESYPAGKFCSSYSGECVAMLEAVKWIENLEQIAGSQTVLIASDSMSLAQTLKKDNWKDNDIWIKKIKDKICKLKSEITLLWIPSHCDIEGNERADELANTGTDMSQEFTPVTHKIVKAKIKNRKWVVQHARAAKTYESRRSPKVEIEKKWPRNVRSLYARLRSGHAAELKKFRFFIEKEEDAMCEEGCGEEESIEHVLCRCNATLAARVKLCESEVTIQMMTTDPDTCRKILMTRFGQLRLPEENKSPTTQLETSCIGLVDTIGGVPDGTEQLPAITLA